MNEWLTAKELSDILGITPQAIYKRSDTEEFKPHIKLVGKVGNKKLFNKSVLELFEVPEVAKEPPTVDNRLQSDISDTLTLLKEQLTVKDRQIAEVTGQLVVKDKQLAEANERLKDSNDRLQEAQELQRNSQVLLAQAQTKLELLPPPAEPKKGFFSRMFQKK